MKSEEKKKRKNIDNKKINCMHCDTHIANKHTSSGSDAFTGSYGNQETIVATKKAIITKSKVRGTKDVERYSDDVTIGFISETQLKCLNCHKHTTVKTYNEISYSS